MKTLYVLELRTLVYVTKIKWKKKLEYAAVLITWQQENNSLFLQAARNKVW